MAERPAQPVDVMIVDDHEIVRLGVRRLLEEAGFSVAEADSGEAALQALHGVWRPRVVLMDIHMPGIGGLEATQRILQRHANIPVIILTATSEGPLPRALLKAGVSGYITKGSSVSQMTEAIRRVRAGEKYISAQIAQQLALSLIGEGNDSPFDQLSHRELQYVVMLSQGLTTGDIAQTMCVSPKTVSTYRTRTMQKLGLGSDAELIKLALEHGVAERS